MSGECDDSFATYTDRKSIEITQEDFKKMNYRPQSCYETGWTKDERYILNNIRSERLERLEKERNNE